MKMGHKMGDNRIVYFDNIRYLMVLLVVVLHSACGYSNNTQWWAVNDSNSIFFDYLLGVLGVFLMPTLFFIAGYFALPSLYEKGKWLFIKSKLKRLGIPWLLGVVLMVPIYNFIHLYSRDYPISHLSLWSRFVENIKGALSLHTGFITSPLQFQHKHFWFISLLFVFFILFAFLHDAKKRWITKELAKENLEVQTAKSILLVLTLVGVLTAAITFLIHGIFHGTPNKDPWITVASLIQFQASKIILYISCFSLGVYAFAKKWFQNGTAPGHFIFWTILSIGLMYCQSKVLIILMTNFSIGFALGYVLMRTFLVFTILLALISFGINHWHNPSKVSRQLSANSYNIYLLHMIFVVVIQLFLLQWASISIVFKFGLVTLSSILFSYLTSQYAIRPFPKISVAGILCLFVILVSVLNPATI
jgi:peptidoglycan/LPS O-acetylase OafA/YrhL